MADVNTNVQVGIDFDVSNSPFEEVISNSDKLLKNLASLNIDIDTIKKALSDVADIGKLDSIIGDTDKQIIELKSLEDSISSFREKVESVNALSFSDSLVSDYNDVNETLNTLVSNNEKLKSLLKDIDVSNEFNIGDATDTDSIREIIDVLDSYLNSGASDFSYLTDSLKYLNEEFDSSSLIVTKLKEKMDSFGESRKYIEGIVQNSEELNDIFAGSEVTIDGLNSKITEIYKTMDSKTGEVHTAFKAVEITSGDINRELEAQAENEAKAAEEAKAAAEAEQEARDKEAKAIEAARVESEEYVRSLSKVTTKEDSDGDTRKYFEGVLTNLAQLNEVTAGSVINIDGVTSRISQLSETTDSSTGELVTSFKAVEITAGDLNRELEAQASELAKIEEESKAAAEAEQEARDKEAKAIEAARIESEEYVRSLSKVTTKEDSDGDTRKYFEGVLTNFAKLNEVTAGSIIEIDGVTSRISQLSETTDSSTGELVTSFKAVEVTASDLNRELEAQSSELDKILESNRVENFNNAVREVYDSWVAVNGSVTDLNSNTSSAVGSIDKVTTKLDSAGKERNYFSGTISNFAELGEVALNSEIQINGVTATITKLNETTDSSGNIVRTFEAMQGSAREVNRELGNSAKGWDAVKAKAVEFAGVALDKLIDLAAAAVEKVVELVGEVVNLGKSFEYAEAKVSTLTSGTFEDYNDVQKEAASIATKYGKDIVDVTESIYDALSSGVSEDNVFNFVESSSKLATAGFTDVQTASEGLISVLNAYGGEMKGLNGEMLDLNELANRFVITQDLGRAEVGDLAENIGKVAPSAALVGVSVDEMLASVASISAVTGDASDTMTQLNAILTSVSTASDKTKKAAKEMGIDFSSSAIQAKGIYNWLAEVAEKTGGNDELIADLFPDVREFKGFAALTTQTSRDIYNDYIEAIESGSSKIDENLENVTETVQNKSDRLKAYFQALGLNIYDGLSGPLGNMYDLAIEALEGVQEAFEEGGLEGVLDNIDTILDGVKDKLGNLGEDFGDLLGNAINILVELLPSAAEILITGLLTALIAILDNAGEIGEAAITLVTSLIDAISEILPDLLQSLISGALDLVITLLMNTDKLLDSLVTLLESTVEALISSIPTIISKIPGVLIGTLSTLISSSVGLSVKLGDAIIDLVSKAFNYFKEKGFKGFIQDLMTFYADIVQNSIYPAVSKLLSIIDSVFGSNLEEKFTNLVGTAVPIDEVEDTADEVVEIVEDAVDETKDAMEGVKDTAEEVQEALVDSLSLEEVKKINSDYLTQLKREQEDYVTYTKRLNDDEKESLKTANKQALEDIKKIYEEKKKLAKQSFDDAKREADDEYNRFKNAQDEAKAQREMDKLNKQIEDKRAELAKYGDYNLLVTSADRKAYKSLEDELEKMIEDKNEKELEAEEERALKEMEILRDAAKNRAEAEYNTKVESLDNEKEEALATQESINDAALKSLERSIEDSQTMLKRAQEDFMNSEKARLSEIEDAVKDGASYMVDETTGALVQIDTSLLNTKSNADSLNDSFNNIADSASTVSEKLEDIGDKVKGLDNEFDFDTKVAEVMLDYFGGFIPSNPSIGASTKEAFNTESRLSTESKTHRGAYRSDVKTENVSVTNNYYTPVVDETVRSKTRSSMFNSGLDSSIYN